MNKFVKLISLIAIIPLIGFGCAVDCYDSVGRGLLQEVKAGRLPQDIFGTRILISTEGHCMAAVSVPTAQTPNGGTLERKVLYNAFKKEIVAYTDEVRNDPNFEQTLNAKCLKDTACMNQSDFLIKAGELMINPEERLLPPLVAPGTGQ